jgi:hypothetical protein
VKLSRSIVALALESFILGSLILVGLTLPATAASNSSDSKSSSGSKKSSSSSSSTITANNSNSSGLQGYAADTTLQVGTIVQLDSKDAHKVLPATKEKLEQMYGVVIDQHQLSLTISDDSLKNQTYVATAGTYNVLVSNENGTIAPGDYVTLSSVDGVAMRADTTQKTVFGRAGSGFDGKAKVLGSTGLKMTGGAESKTVQIGILPIAINIQHNPNDKTTKANLPKELQRIGLAIAEKPVGPIRIYLSVAITVASLSIALVMLYAGVRNAVVSIGRNPLSKKSIVRGLIEIVLMSFLVVIIGLFAVYLLLKL